MNLDTPRKVYCCEENIIIIIVNLFVTAEAEEPIYNICVMIYTGIPGVKKAFLLEQSQSFFQSIQRDICEYGGYLLSIVTSTIIYVGTTNSLVERNCYCKSYS